MRKPDFTSCIRLLSLVLYHDHYEIIELHISVLQKINLSFLDLDQTVASVGDVQLHRMPEDQVNHVIIPCEEQLLDLILLDVHVGVYQGGNLQLQVLRYLGNRERAVNERATLLQIRIHDQRQKVIRNHVFVELLHLFLVGVLLLGWRRLLLLDLLCVVVSSIFLILCCLRRCNRYHINLRLPFL